MAGYDRALLEQHMKLFRQLAVERSSNKGFESFYSNSFTRVQEEYKERVFIKASECLNTKSWKESTIGQGKITRAVIKAVDVADNLINYKTKRAFKEKMSYPKLWKSSDRCFFDLYVNNDYEASFHKLTEEIYGGQYSVAAYLYFIADKDRFLPCASSHFENRFRWLGYGDVKMQGSCTWENYNEFINRIREIQMAASEYYGFNLSLLQAHSLVWMFHFFHSKSDGGDVRDDEANKYSLQKVSDKKTVPSLINARLGQGKYRDLLIDFWGGCCSVTGCGNTSLLVASHIKPWRDCTDKTWGDVHNGLLLTPNLDKCFDSGLISFDQDGHILISIDLSETDRMKLGINEHMKLRIKDPERDKYMAYHREKVFERTRKT